MSRYELLNRYVPASEALEVRRRALERGENINIIDPEIDQKWAQAQTSSGAPRTYFDYFYAGEDIRVHVGETGDDPDFGDIPIMQLGFNVEQQKMPLYGYASYTYDAMLRGTRIVNGVMSIASRYPNYMKDLLSRAAQNRQANRHRLEDDYPSPAGWRDDDENIETYWGRNLDVSALAQGRTEWSSHPPFSLVIAYGIQDTSYTTDLVDDYSRLSQDNQLMYDTNQRLVESEYINGHASRMILEGCELLAVQRSFTPGEVVMETYSFMARDVITPTPDWLSRRGAPTRASLPNNRM